MTNYMDNKKPKVTIEARNQVAQQIAQLGMSLMRMQDNQDQFKKLGIVLVTSAGAFLNPFHAEELFKIVSEFNTRKLNEELAKRN
jgi:hypothetical protein